LRRLISRREEQGMDYRKEFRVDPDSKVKLSKLDPAYKSKHESQEEAKQETDKYQQKLFQQQALLYAEHKHSILVVLQALDAGGKDGTIKHGFVALNPQGATVASFDRDRARARLSLARPSARAGKRRDRHLQSFALRGRARDASP